VESLGRWCYDVSARARRSSGGDAEKTTGARERDNQSGNGAVHATGGVVASCTTHWGLTSGTNGDVRTPRVQARGVTGELPSADAISIQSLIPTENRFCTSINS